MQKPEEFTDEDWARAAERIKQHPELAAEIEQSRAEFAAGKGIPLDELIRRVRAKK